MLMAEQILYFSIALAHCSSMMTNAMNELVPDIRDRENLVQNGTENGEEIKFNHSFLQLWK